MRMKDIDKQCIRYNKDFERIHIPSARFLFFRDFLI